MYTPSPLIAHPRETSPRPNTYLNALLPRLPVHLSRLFASPQAGSDSDESQIINTTAKDLVAGRDEAANNGQPEATKMLSLERQITRLEACVRRGEGRVRHVHLCSRY